MTIWQAIIIAIIEGLTEFLPVSSTGHMILASSLMGIQNDEFVKSFEVLIQLGAILSVLAIYYKRFLVSFEIYFKLFVAFLPTGIIGILAYKTIKSYLFNPFVVSVSLIIGGVVLILLDRWTEKKESKYLELEHISYLDAFKIGLIQCLSMIPGVSRSAATILEEFIPVSIEFKLPNFPFYWQYPPCLRPLAMTCSRITMLYFKGI